MAMIELRNYKKIYLLTFLLLPISVSACHPDFFKQDDRPTYQDEIKTQEYEINQLQAKVNKLQAKVAALEKTLQQQQENKSDQQKAARLLMHVPHP